MQVIYEVQSDTSLIKPKRQTPCADAKLARCSPLKQKGQVVSRVYMQISHHYQTRNQETPLRAILFSLLLSSLLFPSLPHSIPISHHFISQSSHFMNPPSEGSSWSPVYPPSQTRSASLHTPLQPTHKPYPHTTSSFSVQATTSQTPARSPSPPPRPGPRNP